MQCAHFFDQFIFCNFLHYFRYSNVRKKISEEFFCSNLFEVDLLDA